MSGTFIAAVCKSGGKNVDQLVEPFCDQYGKGKEKTIMVVKWLKE